jgi:hypothetical protein
MPRCPLESANDQDSLSLGPDLSPGCLKYEGVPTNRPQRSAFLIKHEFIGMIFKRLIPPTRHLCCRNPTGYCVRNKHYLF